MRSKAIWSLRWLPFTFFAGLTLWVAGGLPHGRKPFSLDLSLSLDSLTQSLNKWPHYRTTAVLFLVAAVAAGMRRPWLAFGMTMLVGAGWELAETTAIGHTARAADLAPDLLAALACLAVLFLVRGGVTRWTARRTVRLERLRNEAAAPAAK